MRDELTLKAKREACTTVNLALVPTKAVAFLICGSYAAINPFLGLYMRHIGLIPPESGIIGCTLPFIGCVTAPLFGTFADKYQKHKATAMFSAIAAGVSLACLPFVPSNVYPNSPVVINDTNITSSYLAENIACSNLSLVKENCGEILAKSEVGNSTRLPVSPSSNAEFSKPCSCSNLNNDNVELVMLTKRIYECLQSNSNSRGLGLKKDSNANTKGDECREMCSRLTALINNSSSIGTHKGPPYGKTFVCFFVIYALGSATLIPLFAISDSMTYAVLKGTNNQWGRQRMWGGLGMSIAALGVSVYIDSRGESTSMLKYSACFYTFFAGMAMVALCLYLYKLPDDCEAPNVLNAATSLFKSFATVSMFITLTIFGLYLGAIGTFAYWHIMDKAQTNGPVYVRLIIVGLTVTVDGLAEIPVFYFSANLISKIGHVPSLAVVAVSYAARLVSYSFITNPWYLPLTAPLNALSYGLTLAVCVSYANAVAPPGMGGTLQCVLRSFHNGLGSGLGAVLTGFLFHAIGGDWTFRLYAMTSICIVLPFLAVQWCVVRLRRDVTDRHGEEYTSLPGKNEPMDN